MAGVARPWMRTECWERKAMVDIICVDCCGPIGNDKRHPNMYQLEDGRTVCHSCYRKYLKRAAYRLLYIFILVCLLWYFNPIMLLFPAILILCFIIGFCVSAINEHMHQWLVSRKCSNWLEEL